MKKSDLKNYDIIVLTDDEKAILRSLPKEYKFIVRDKNGSLYVYKDKPLKGNAYWYSNYEYDSIYIFDHLFNSIKFEDEEPYSIEELLKESE